MRFKSAIFVLIIFALCRIQSVQAAGQMNTQEIDSNLLLMYDTPYKFTYTLPESGFLNVLNEPDEIRLLIYTNLQDDPRSIPMEREGRTWHATWVLADTSVKMILYAFEANAASYMKAEKLTDNNYGKYYDLLVHTEAGTPVYGAFQARAVSWTGYGSRRPERLRSAAEDVKTEIERFPENYSARLLLYTIGLRQKGYDDYTRQRVAADIEKTLATFGESEGLYKFAAAGYRLIGYDEKAASFDEKLIALNPQGDQAAGKAFEEIMEIEDLEKQWDALEGFLKIYPDSRYTEYALSTLTGLAIERQDTLAFTRLGDRMLYSGGSPATARALAGLAGIMSAREDDLNRAFSYISRAVEIIGNTDESLRPASVSSQGWMNQLRSTEARYRDILGWIYFQQGNAEKALTELRAAAEYAHEPGTLFHLARVLEETGNTGEALKMYARAAVYGGDTGDLAYSSFEALWTQTGRPDAEIEAFLEVEQNWLADDYKKRVLALRSIRKAPDFELESINGGWVRLSDQRGSVMVLCFWATWSEPSLRILKALEDLAAEYGESVLFLTVATNRDISAINKFVDMHDISFPVLMNDGTDTDYQLQGVPTLFVIDSRGSIHFEHRGYKGDILDQLIVEIEDLL